MIHLGGDPIVGIERKLSYMNEIQAHRGPDGQGIWVSRDSSVGFSHRRLSIVDLSEDGAQPMEGPNGTVITYNGEVYNYLELRSELSDRWSFRSQADTEVILAAHDRYGASATGKFRGMFAYALYDAKAKTVSIVRDPFGIKPLYYAVVQNILFFASEAKTLIPFLPEVETDEGAFAEYVALQIPLSERTMFKGVFTLKPGHMIDCQNGQWKIEQYWKTEYSRKTKSTLDQSTETIRELLNDSLRLHLRSDVPVGAYLSGGVDSSLIAILAADSSDENRDFFHGKFTQFPGYDESRFARDAASLANGNLHEIDITAQDFVEAMPKIIYHLDQPMAGPGSFPQYMVSKLSADHVKVVLGGQGGDEIFGGYTRYFIGMLEQLLGSAINGASAPPTSELSLTDLIPNLAMLKEYQPLIRSTWSQGLFGPLSGRYFQMINRTADMAGEIDLDDLPMKAVFERFKAEFEAPGTADHADLDKMMRFDFRFLLPALLQVEDRMGMAHGLESRVPFLDRPLVEYVASLSPQVKLEGGNPKSLLRRAFGQHLPASILTRRDKMGFPVPLKEWFTGELSDYMHDMFRNTSSKHRRWINSSALLSNLGKNGAFSRTAWGMLSLELWHQQFHDVAHLGRKHVASLCD